MIKLTIEEIRRIETALMTEIDLLENSLQDDEEDKTEEDIKYAKRDIKTNKQLVNLLEQATSVIIETNYTTRNDNN